MKRFRLAILFAILAATAYAQSASQDDEDIQSWNDVTLTVPLSKRFDYFNKVTMRIGKNVTRVSDGRFQVGFAWKPTRALSIAPFYWSIKARNSAGQFRIENRLNLGITYRFPISMIGLVHRSTFEKRIRAVNTWRYRAMMTIEKDFPKTMLPGAKFFISDEVFYDSATGKFSRNRFSAGISKAITKQLALDAFYMRQNDGFSHPGDLNIVGTSWKVKL
jgi:hypothetical protein